MKLLRRILLTIFMFLFFVPNLLLAIEVHVTTAEQLQSALTQAQENDDDYTIYLAAGIYVGSFTYEYTGDRYKDLTIMAEEGVETSQVILDGKDSGRVLRLDASENLVNIAVENITIKRGASDSNGGGIYVNTSGNVVLNNLLIEENTGVHGGGVYIYYGKTIELNGNAFANNTSTDIDSSNYSRAWGGGGVNIVNGDSISLSRNTFLNNTTGAGGGGCLIDNGNAISITRNNFTGNSARYGGGCKISEGTSVILSQNNFTDNSSSKNKGGGFYTYEVTSLDVTSNLFMGNSAETTGGGCYLGVTSELNFTNNTVIYNFAKGHAGGVYLNKNGAMRLYNNIVWYNESSTAQDDILSEASGTDNRLHNNNFNVMVGSWKTRSLNINADPEFVSDGDYHLSSSSPCIDTGNNAAYGLPAYDQDDNPRIINSFVDMGAYEYDGTGTLSVCSTDTPEKCLTQYDCELIGNVWWGGICYHADNVGGGFTQNDMDVAIEAAIQECVNDPASCGIDVGTSRPPFTGTLPEGVQSYLVLTDASAPFYLSAGNYVQTVGSEAANTVNIEKSARVEFKNSIGDNIVNIEDVSSEFIVYRLGATVYLNSTSGTRVEIAATDTPQTLRFSDGSLELATIAGNVMLGDQIVDETEKEIEADVDNTNTSESVF